MKRSRQEKYPETKTFHYYNANPKNRITGDCEFRAISLGLNQDYNITVMEMAELMCKTGYALNDVKGEAKYLEMKGWIKHKQPKKPDGTKYTGREFCELLNKDVSMIGKRVIAHIGGHHVVCIKEVDDRHGFFKVHDIWNSTDGCIGNYWVEDYHRF